VTTWLDREAVPFIVVVAAKFPMFAVAPCPDIVTGLAGLSAMSIPAFATAGPVAVLAPVAPAAAFTAVAITRDRYVEFAYSPPCSVKAPGLVVDSFDHWFAAAPESPVYPATIIAFPDTVEIVVVP
jgi:hypothetical protein